MDNFILSKKKEMSQHLRNLRYEENGYFWIHDSHYKLIMHPFWEKEVGTSQEFLKDEYGKFVIKDIVDKSKLEQNKDGIFVKYNWNKPFTEKHLDKEKLSFVKYIKEWDWVIGKGVYLEDINTHIKNQQEEYSKKIFILYEKIVGIFVILFLIIIIASIKLSDIISKHFNIYSNTISFAKNNLERIVIQRTNELNLINRELENKINEAVRENTKKELLLLEQSKFVQLGEMIGYIAHQWRQPLSVIRSSATGILVQKEHGLLTDSDLEINLRYIDENTKILSETIDKFRDFVKEERVPTVVILEDRLNTIFDIVESSLLNNFIIIEKHFYTQEILEISLVLGELSQIIINIINNSKEAFENKNIKNKKVVVETGLEDEEHIFITIRDNAGGIADDIKDKIFEPYFTTKHQFQGTGLGLYMSKKIVEKNLKGKLTFRNVDNGAEFKILLPRFNHLKQ